MTGTRIVPLVDEGLGNSVYLADLGDGRALAVDVSRDLRAVRAAAGSLGLRIASAAETHLHADFLSGARQLAAGGGAQILCSAAGQREFPHRGLADGDEVDLGGLTLRAWATPGHTAEHLSFLLLDGSEVVGVFTGGSLLALPPQRVRALAAEGAQIIDVRPVDAYTAGHIPGSLAIPLRAVFATWLGWLVPSPDTPLIFVRDPGQDPGEIAWQALKVGYGNLAGELAGGLPAWAAAQQPVSVTSLITPAEVDPARVIDVRQASEYAGGHLPGARNIELGALAGQASALAGQAVVTMCGHDERAATAASVLERAGHGGVAVLPGGPPEWSRVTGLPVEAGA